MSYPITLTCPIIRPAKAEDAESIATVMLESNSDYIDSIFRNCKQRAHNLLKEQYSKNLAGIYVLTDETRVIGVMKLHLPGIKMGKTISIRSLVSSLGILKGIRALLLMSNWDEYKISPGEAYIEFIHVMEKYKTSGCHKILFDRAKILGSDYSATHLSIYVPLRGYKDIGIVETAGFDMRRKIGSPIAKLFKVNHKWRKYTYTLIDGPLTVKEQVSHKISKMKSTLRSRKKEAKAALRFSILLTIVPIVAGCFAYFRGYEPAAAGWGILTFLHLLGGWLFLNNFIIGKYSIAVVMVSEISNLTYRAINVADNWFDRGWLIPLAFINLWILLIVLTSRMNRMNVSMQAQTVNIKHMD